MDGAAGAEGIQFSDPVQPETGVAGRVLAGRYRVLPDRRLNPLDSPRAKAYAVVDEAEPEAELFCLVSPPEALPRVRVARHLLAGRVEGMLTPLAAEHCHWPPLEGSATAFVFPRPVGSRLSPGCAQGLSTAEIARTILAPLVRALSSVGARDLTHRAVRADNLFWSDPHETEIVLGECVTAAAGTDQPAVYEPITRMTATAAGRGPGAPEDDLFALGVAIIDLVYGLRGADGYPPGLVSRKLEQGSLASLLPRSSPAPELAALLRGLLTDDPDRRWNARHLSQWLAGDPIDTPHPIAVRAAQRPIVLGKRRFRTARSLAHGLWWSRDQAIPMLRDGTIEHWLRNSLNDPHLAFAISREVRESTSKPVARSLARHVLLARCCKVLDPAGPIRFGSIAAMPDAYGSVLASLVLRQADTTDLRDLLRTLASGDLLQSRREDEAIVRGEPQELVRRLDGGVGGGILRCLYDLDPDLPCLSSLLEEPVEEPRALLEALERRAGNLVEGSALMDDHVIAFVASKLGVAPLRGLVTGQREGGVVGVPDHLRLLALAQAYRGPPALPSLARVAAVKLSPVIRQVRNKGLRKQLAAAVAECVEKGDLPALIERLENPAVWQRDRAGFGRAQREFALRRAELERLADPERSGMSAALDEGRRLAVAVSLSIALASLSALLLVV